MMNDDSFYNQLNFIRKLLDQQGSWEKQLRSSVVYSAMAEAQRIQEQFHVSGIHSAIAEAKRMQEQFHVSGIHSAIAEAQRIQEQFHASSIHNAIADAQRVVQEHLRVFDIHSAIADAQRMQPHFASSVITRLSEMAENLRSVDYVIKPDGTITGQNTTFKQSEVQRIIESYLETAPTADKSSFEITINNILSNIAKQHPIIIKFVVHILLVLFLNFVSGNYFSPPVHIDYALLSKQLKKEIKVGIDHEFYRHYRFVSAPSLTVWSKNSTQSRYVGKLYFGYLVRVVQKKKHWSLIEYRGKEGDVIIQGWVFTRYIKRFD